jgi:hypothetical protein
MALGSFARKVAWTGARVIPQRGMVSQAVAFNMFLVFFRSRLVALGLMNRSLRGTSGQDLAARLTTILLPGSRQLASIATVFGLMIWMEFSAVIVFPGAPETRKVRIQSCEQL